MNQQRTLRLASGRRVVCVPNNDSEFIVFKSFMNFAEPENFSFKNTIYSHGWSELLPFEVDDENLRLTYVFTDKDFSEPLSATISETAKNIKIEFQNESIPKICKLKVKEKVKHILRLDEDFSEFYELTENDEDFQWMAEKNIGRLMRSPTVFEDLVKTICTTNCSWALTKNMTRNLVENLGEKSSDGKKSFPTPEALARVDEKFYRETIRAGYRSTYFVELANAIANGKMNPEGWLNSDLPTSDLKKEMKKIKGVGDYAAENLLKLVGRYDGLALDYLLRSKFYKKHNNDIVCDDKIIKKFYDKFGEFRGLAIWFDLTKRWFD